MSALSLSPMAAAARLVGRRGRVLLHSARDDDGLGAWSFCAAEPTATLIARGRSLVRLDERGRPAKRFTADPFEAAEAFLAEHGCTLGPRAPGPPDARVIGFFSYDLARVIEQLPGASARACKRVMLSGASTWQPSIGCTVAISPQPCCAWRSTTR